MKKAVEILGVAILMLTLWACSPGEKKIARDWALESAVEEYEEKSGREAVVKIEDFDGVYVDGEITAQTPREDSREVSRIFKVTFTVLETIEIGGELKTTYFVTITWEPLGFQDSKSAFYEEAIVSIEIKKTKEVD